MDANLERYEDWRQREQRALREARRAFPLGSRVMFYSRKHGIMRGMILAHNKKTFRILPDNCPSPYEWWNCPPHMLRHETKETTLDLDNIELDFGPEDANGRKELT